jgi:hemerythrin-like domain-containing protein
MMDYLTRLRKEHELLRMMGVIIRELVGKLGEGKAVNLSDLEDVYRLCREYLVARHLSSEEEYVFSKLKAMNHPLLAQMVQAHEEMKSRIGEIGETIERLRLGRPNSGRELVRAGESFLWLFETHLREEDQILIEFGHKEGEDYEALTKVLTEGVGDNLKELGVLLQRLAKEYAGKELNLQWLGLVEEESIQTPEASPVTPETALNLQETVKTAEEVNEAIEKEKTVEEKISLGEEADQEAPEDEAAAQQGVNE